MSGVEYIKTMYIKIIEVVIKEIYMGREWILTV